MRFKIASSISAVVVSAFMAASCDSMFDIKPSTYIPAEDVWSDPAVVNSVLAQLYSNIQYEEYKYCGDAFFDFGPRTLALWSDEAIVGFNPADGLGSMDAYIGDDWFYTYGDTYKAIRNCNTFLRQMGSAAIDESEKDAIEGEVRFIRAFHYFTLVKRLGGVPLITEVQEYNEDTELTDLQVPRDKEEVIWEFIRSECFDIAENKLPATRDAANRNRVTKYAAWALASRACVYAASIAKYGTLDEAHFVGVPKDKANWWWEQAVTASNKIIADNMYYLEGYDLTDRQARIDNYYSFFLDESNSEYIWFRAYMEPDLVHNYTKMCAPYSFRKGFGYGGSEEPNLEFVEAFEYVDDFDGTLKVERTVAINRTERIQYDNLIDIFENKDPRLFATVGLPGDKYQDGILEIRRGVSNGGQIPDVGSSNYPGNMEVKIKLADGNEITGIGKDGPYEQNEPTKTGFYLRKFVVEDQVDYDKCTNPWPVFRLAEIYLNLAEALTELGRESEALVALNMTRHRAGIHEITMSDVSSHESGWLLDRVRNERRVELAYENHRFWDLRRWRIAATPRADNGGTGVLDGYPASALYPWAVYEAGAEIDPETGLMTPKKYVFSKEYTDGQRLQRARKHFYQRNYYLKFREDDLKTNPRLVNNPEF